MATDVLVFTRNGRKGAWSRYRFPFDVEAFAQLGKYLYVKHGAEVSRVDTAYAADVLAAGTQVIPGTVQWNWLDFGSPGRDKNLHSVDLIASGTPTISIGYNQRTPTSNYTTGVLLTTYGDTVPDEPIPIPVCAPSFSLKITWIDSAWTVKGAALNITDKRGGL